MFPVPVNPAGLLPDAFQAPVQAVSMTLYLVCCPVFLVWANMTYHPGKDRQEPYLLEYSVELPPDSVLKVQMEFDKAFLIWNEFPPDAHHGFYVG